MISETERITIDRLVNEFWRLGYFTLRRRYGTFLPEPGRVGKFKVDIVGRQNKRYAIGITLGKEDFSKNNLIEKLTYLASRHTRFSNKPVTLIVGVQEILIDDVKTILKQLDDEIRKNIKLIRITENPNAVKQKSKNSREILFS